MELLFQMVVPLTIAAVALWGMARRVDVYGALAEGAGEGLGVLITIVGPPGCWRRWASCWRPC